MPETDNDDNQGIETLELSEAESEYVDFMQAFADSHSKPRPQQHSCVIGDSVFGSIDVGKLRKDVLSKMQTPGKESGLSCLAVPIFDPQSHILKLQITSVPEEIERGLQSLIDVLLFLQNECGGSGKFPHVYELMKALCFYMDGKNSMPVDTVKLYDALDMLDIVASEGLINKVYEDAYEDQHTKNFLALAKVHVSKADFRCRFEQYRPENNCHASVADKVRKRIEAEVSVQAGKTKEALYAFFGMQEMPHAEFEYSIKPVSEESNHNAVADFVDRAVESVNSTALRIIDMPPDEDKAIDPGDTAAHEFSIYFSSLKARGRNFTRVHFIEILMILFDEDLDKPNDPDAPQPEIHKYRFFNVFSGSAESERCYTECLLQIYHWKNFLMTRGLLTSDTKLKFFRRLDTVIKQND
jgi:hypothetical protein